MGNIKTGYPHPDYTDDDIGMAPVRMEQVIESDEIVIIHPSEYKQLCQKAAALDILTASLQRKGEVNDDIVWAVTGAQTEPEVEKLKKEVSERFDWYWKERTRADKLSEENQILQRKLAEAECSLNELHRDDPDWPPKDEEVSENGQD